MEKKKNKLLPLISGIVLLLPAIPCRFIFMMADSKKNSIEEFEYYDWRLGQIHYKVKGHGKSLLLLHGIGIGASMREWDKNFETLSENYRVYAIDLLGFGLSDKPKTTYTAYMYASLIQDFLKDVVKKPCGLIASSNSAAFAVMACRMDNSLIKKMILIEPTGIENKNAENKDIWYRRLFESPYAGTILYTALSSRIFIRRFLQKAVFFAQENYSARAVTDSYYYPAHAGGISAKYAAASFLTNYMNLDIKKILKDIHTPLMIIWGENAVINPTAAMDIIMEIKPRAQYAVFEKTRLLPHYENPAEFNELAKDFFH